VSQSLKRRPVRITVASMIAALLVLAIGVSSASAAKPPKTMASLGDSITQAFNAPNFGDNPGNSWSTGDNPAVNSQFLRIQAINPNRNPVAFNDAVSGARMEHLQAQAANAVSQGADYVTIEMGGNDACKPTIAQQTPTATYRAQFQAAIDTIRTGLPKAYIFVASLPNINMLHTIFTSPAPDPNALTRWSVFNVCQALLANPTSTAPADVQRRADFQAQVIAYNGVLSDVCNAVSQNRCKYDGGAAYNTSFTKSDVANVTNTTGVNAFPFNVLPIFGPGNANSTADYFHPSLTGQAKIADITWASTYSFD
jgi:lysophospholipase L1-like esterase